MAVLLVVWLGLVPLVPLLSIPFSLSWHLHLVLVAALGVLALPRLLRGPPPRLGVTAIAVGLALLSLGLAVAFAPPSAPRRDLLVAALTGLAHAAFFLLCLGALPDADSPPAHVRRTRNLLAWALGALLAGQFAAMLAEGQLTDPLHRPDGTLGNPNVLGALVGATMLACIGLFALRGLRLALLLPLLPYLLLTRSRGAVLATGLTLLLLAVHWRLRALLVVVAVLAALIVVVPNPLRERVLNLQPDHAYSRPFLWLSAIERSAEVPFGIGPGMNRYDFPPRAFDPEHPWLLHQRRGIGLTHNVFTTLWLEWGWLAGASLLALTAWVTWRLVRTRLLEDDPLALGAGLGACVLFFELQVDGVEQNPFAFSVFLLLVATALARVARRGAARGPALPRWLVAGGAVLLVLVLGAGVTWRWTATLRLRAAQSLAASPQAAGVDEVRAAFDAAERVVPRDADASMGRFRFERDRVLRLLDEPAGDTSSAQQRAAELRAGAELAFAALERARRAAGADPDLPDLGAQFALQCHYRMGRAPEDLASYVSLKQAALALDPLDVQGHWDLAREAQRSKLMELENTQMDRVLELEPDFAEAWYVLARLAHAAEDRERALYGYLRAAEAVLNCQRKVLVGHPASQAFYQRNLDRVDLAEVWMRVWHLRRELYF